MAMPAVFIVYELCLCPQLCTIWCLALIICKTYGRQRHCALTEDCSWRLNCNSSGHSQSHHCHHHILRCLQGLARLEIGSSRSAKSTYLQLHTNILYAQHCSQHKTQILHAYCPQFLFQHLDCSFVLTFKSLCLTQLSKARHMKSVQTPRNESLLLQALTLAISQAAVHLERGGHSSTLIPRNSSLNKLVQAGVQISTSNAWLPYTCLCLADIILVPNSAAIPCYWIPAKHSTTRDKIYRPSLS